MTFSTETLILTFMTVGLLKGICQYHYNSFEESSVENWRDDDENGDQSQRVIHHFFQENKANKDHYKNFMICKKNVFHFFMKILIFKNPPVSNFNKCQNFFLRYSLPAIWLPADQI